jgi:hypothetical protein
MRKIRKISGPTLAIASILLIGALSRASNSSSNAKATASNPKSTTALFQNGCVSEKALSAVVPGHAASTHNTATSHQVR